MHVIPTALTFSRINYRVLPTRPYPLLHTPRVILTLLAPTTVDVGKPSCVHLPLIGHGLSRRTVYWPVPNGIQRGMTANSLLQRQRLLRCGQALLNGAATSAYACGRHLALAFLNDWRVLATCVKRLLRPSDDQRSTACADCLRGRRQQHPSMALRYLNVQFLSTGT